MKTTLDLSSGLPKIPVCKISLSYDDRYYIDFMGGNANQSHIFLWFSRESPQGGLGTFSESPQSVLRESSERPQRERLGKQRRCWCV